MMTLVFAEDGIEAGTATYIDLRARQPDVVDEKLVNALGLELLFVCWCLRVHCKKDALILDDHKGETENQKSTPTPSF